MQNLYVDDLGEGYPLVLVHGYLGSSEMWNLQKEFLSKHFRIIQLYQDLVKVIMLNQ